MKCVGLGILKIVRTWVLLVWSFVIYSLTITCVVSNKLIVSKRCLICVVVIVSCSILLHRSHVLNSIFHGNQANLSHVLFIIKNVEIWFWICKDKVWKVIRLPLWRNSSRIYYKSCVLFYPIVGWVILMLLVFEILSFDQILVI